MLDKHCAWISSSNYYPYPKILFAILVFFQPCPQDQSEIFNVFPLQEWENGFLQQFALSSFHYASELYLASFPVDDKDSEESFKPQGGTEAR